MLDICKSKGLSDCHNIRVCYLARARAMARVVLAQIEFARAICRVYYINSLGEP